MKKFLITVLVIVLLILIGDICYIKFFKDNNTEENNEQTNEVTLVSLLDESEFLTDEDKLDPALPFVYEIAPVYEIETVEGKEERKYTGEFAYEGNNLGEYKVPFINLKGDVNEQANRWMKLASLLVNTTKGSLLDKADESTLSYSYVTTKDNVMSFKIEGNVAGFKFINGINLKLQDKTVVSFNRWAKENITVEELEKIAGEIISKIETNPNANCRFMNQESASGLIYYQRGGMSAGDNDFLHIDDNYFYQILDQEIDCAQYCEKYKIFDDSNKYIGYIVKPFDFINDDGTYDEDKFDSFLFIHEANYGFDYWYDENDNMIIANAFKTNNDSHYEIATISR